MAERVAIVGSRAYPRLIDVRAYVSGLPPDTIVVSGGARGVDCYAMNCARALKLAVEIYAPDYRAHGRRAPLIRNQTIVDRCDRLVAFWDGRSTGTMHAIRLARRAGKPIQIFGVADAS